MRQLSAMTSSEFSYQVRHALGMTQRNFADAVGSSLRTVSRWAAGQAYPDAPDYHRMAALVHARNPDLAEEAATRGGRTLEELGIVAPSPPAAPEPAQPARFLGDSVIFAALDATDPTAPLTPQRARAMVHAAFVRARDLRMTIDAAVDAVAPAPAPSGKRRT
jgi:transcriptional regulator with XRE-family HTH domain